MGESLSKFENPLDRPMKRFKSEDKSPAKNTNNCGDTTNESQEGDGCLEATPDKSSETIEEAQYALTGWHQLPHVVLVEIYRHLSNNDKLSASLTCRAWLEPFSRPGHWTQGNFKFNNKDEWRALQFSLKMGSAVRHITVDCSFPEGVQCKTKVCTKNFTTFLTRLLERQNFHLVTLKLTNMVRLTINLNEAGCDFFSVLVELLEGQTCLKTLDVADAGFFYDEGLMILLAAANKCGPTIQSLAFTDLMFPDPTFDIFSDGRFLNALSRFVNLSELRLCYKSLSDDVLILLSSTVPGKLKYLHINACCFLDGDSRTSVAAWQHLTGKCPGLEASYDLKEVTHDIILRRVLTPAIPLCVLRWSSDNYTDVDITKNCFRHIASNFQHSLRHICLDIYQGFFDEEKELANLIDKCERLETLTIDSKMEVPQQIRVERAIRQSLVNRPDHRLRKVIINKEEISLEETWLTSLLGWMIVNVN